MTKVGQIVRSFLTAKHGCPQPLHRLAVAMQAWALGIFLHTFSGGAFIARFIWFNRLDSSYSFALLPQFWYVVLGCTLPLCFGHYLKRRARVAWTGSFLLMAGIVVGCLALMLPMLCERYRLGLVNLAAHAFCGTVGLVILFRNREAVFLVWEGTPKWACATEQTVSFFGRLRSWIPKPNLNFGYAALFFLVIGGIGGAIHVLAESHGIGLKTIGLDGTLDMRAAIKAKSMWRQRLSLRVKPWVPYQVSYCLHDTGWEYLGLAIQEGYLESVKLMDDTFCDLVRFSDPQIKQSFREQGLWMALSYAKEEIVEYYLNLDADTGGKNTAYLCMCAAVHSGQVNMVERLIGRGHSLQVKSPWSRNTILVQTVANSDERMARWLIARGVDVDCRNKGGETVLFTAVWQRRLDMMKLFADYGCDPCLVNRKGENLFHIFAQCFHWDQEADLPAIAAWLHSQGVDHNLRDKTDKRPVDHVAPGSEAEWALMMKGVLNHDPSQPQVAPDSTIQGFFSHGLNASQ